MALLEAMSAGCAVITTNVSGCPETVRDAGLLVEPGDSTSIRERIDYLITYPDETEVYQKRARDRVINFFSWDSIVKKYTEVLS